MTYIFNKSFSEKQNNDLILAIDLIQNIYNHTKFKAWLEKKNNFRFTSVVAWKLNIIEKLNKLFNYSQKISLH